MTADYMPRPTGSPTAAATDNSEDGHEVARGIYAIRGLAPLGPLEEAEEALSIHAPDVLAKYRAAESYLASKRQGGVIDGNEYVEGRFDLIRRIIADAAVLRQGRIPEVPSLATRAQLTGKELLDGFRSNANSNKCPFCDTAWASTLPYCRGCRLVRGSKGLEFMVDRCELGTSKEGWDEVRVIFDPEGVAARSSDGATICRVPFTGIGGVDEMDRKARAGFFKQKQTHLGVRISSPEIDSSPKSGWVDLLYSCLRESRDGAAGVSAVALKARLDHVWYAYLAQRGGSH
jgi:hypothetical protein